MIVARVIFRVMLVVALALGAAAQTESELPELSTVLSLFSANAGTEGIRVNWSLDRQSPTIVSFRIYRGYAGVGHFSVLAELAPHSMDSDLTYAFTDTSAIPGVTYYYKLAALGQSDESVFPVVISAAVKRAGSPANPQTPVALLAGSSLELYVREAGLVKLEMIEPEARPLVNDSLAPGVYELDSLGPAASLLRLTHGNGYSVDIKWPIE